MGCIFLRKPAHFQAPSVKTAMTQWLQLRLTGPLAWRSGQPGQMGNQAALTVESVPGSGSSTIFLGKCRTQPAVYMNTHTPTKHRSIAVLRACLRWVAPISIVFSLQACAVVAVADAAVTVVATGVSVTAKAVGAVAKAVIPGGE
jgi:hypothetical protein